MTRRELREQIFKLLFGVEFHDRQELPEQIAVYEETEEPWDAKDGAYISGKCEDIVAHLAERLTRRSMLWQKAGRPDAWER